MNKEILVSVVTITYGHEEFILETIDRVLMQDYPGPIEFIISNDKSPDNTDSIIKKYLKDHIIPSNIEIKYTCHKVNKGVIANFNWALMESKGKYIAICEGDDYWTDPHKLQMQIDFLERNQDYSMCFHNAMRLCDSKKNKPFNSLKKSIEVKIEDIVTNWIIPTASIVFRKTILPLPEWSMDIYSGDQTLALVAISKGKVFYFHSIMSVYRFIIKNNTSMSSQVNKLSEFILNEHIKLYSLYLNDPMCSNEKVIKKKIYNLNQELKFQQFKKHHIIIALFKMPIYSLRKLIYKFSS